MRKLNSRLAVVVAAFLLAVLATGAVLAQGRSEETDSVYDRFTARVATLLGKQPEEVRSAMSQARREMLDEAVAEGKMPAERARKLKERAGKDIFPMLQKGRKGVVGRVTKVEGNELTVETPQGPKAVTLQADTKIHGRAKTKVEIQVGDLIRVMGKREANGSVLARHVQVLSTRHLFKQPFLGEQAAVADFLNMEIAELRAELRAGKSLAEIAGPEKTQGLIDLIVAGVGKRLDEAVADGHLSAEQAERIKDRLSKRAAKLVNKQHGAWDQK